MAQQMYGRDREEPYAPSYGYGQVVETKQTPKKPVVINYYPSGNTNNPQRMIAQVETVTRDQVVRNPGTVIEPVKEIRSHGDSQSRREDEFINTLRDETIKATADLNDASRSIQQPSHIEPKLGGQVVCEEGVCRIIQPKERHGNGAMSDGWSEPPVSADPSHPRKVAELVNRVSNWRGANGSDRGKPISDGYDKWSNNNPAGGYGYNKGFDHGNSRPKPDDGYNRRHNGVNPQMPSGGSGYSYITGSKPPSTQQGYDQYGYNEPRVGYNGGGEGSNKPVATSQLGYGNHGRPTDDGYTRRTEVNPQAPRASYTIGSTNKPLSTQQGYDQYGYTEPQVGYHGGSEGSNKPVATNQLGYGNHGRPTDDGYTRRTEVNPQAPRASYTIGSTNKPLSTQQGYDQYGYTEPQVGYHGGSEGSNKPVVANQLGYGNHGRPTDDGYTRRSDVNPQAPRGGSGYSYTISSTSKPLSKQEGYDQYGYNEPRVGYSGGGEGSIVKPVASNQLGYGYGVDTGNGYGSGSPRPSYVERPSELTSGTVITSVEAVSKYKGTFVPMTKTRREEEAKVLMKI